MSCKFCEFNKYGFAPSIRGFWLEKDEPQIGSYAMCRDENEDDPLSVEQMVEIHYCPMCGRKLEE
jgi:hypothetical protein